MGKAFLAKSNGGGGGGIAFRVIGGTSAPSSPKPNDIWVNTEAEITSYIFSATEPEGYAEGMVWISTGTSSAVAFNALKKNSIQVYPISAKQYVSGAWVNKSAQSYQGGEWIDWWDGELYSTGNEYEDVTGGWVAVALVGNGGGYNYSKAAPTLTKCDEYMDVTQTTAAHGVVRPTNLIDLTNYSTITIKYSALCTTSGAWMCFSVTSRGAYWHGGNAAATANCTTDSDLNTVRTATIDVSSLSGTYDIVVGIGQLACTKTIRIYEITLEE